MKRPDILKKWQEKFQYILVDEFQDVNQAQYDVVRMLAAPQDNLFVVGDDDQSVYGFRGAKPGIMMEFMKDYPKARQILLDVNYRSSGYIVKGALRVIGNNKIRFEKKIEAFRKPDETVHVQEVKDPVQEAEYVLERIREYREKGVSYTEMAVLYRTNVDARAMSELMTEYQIPFVMKEHTFKRDFKKISDLTPEKWLIRKRLEVAYAKMKEGGKKVVDVYAEVGFKNPSHFSTAFKKQYGMEQYFSTKDSTNS